VAKSDTTEGVGWGDRRGRIKTHDAIAERLARMRVDKEHNEIARTDRLCKLQCGSERKPVPSRVHCC